MTQYQRRGFKTNTITQKRGPLLEAHADQSLIIFWGLLQVCVNPEFCTRVLEGRIIPGIAQLTERDPPTEDEDLGKASNVI